MSEKELPDSRLGTWALTAVSLALLVPLLCCVAVAKFFAPKPKEHHR